MAGTNSQAGGEVILPIKGGEEEERGVGEAERIEFIRRCLEARRKAREEAELEAQREEIDLQTQVKLEVKEEVRQRWLEFVRSEEAREAESASEQALFGDPGAQFEERAREEESARNRIKELRELRVWGNSEIRRRVSCRRLANGGDGSSTHTASE